MRWRQGALILLAVAALAAGAIALAGDDGREAAGDYEREARETPAEVREFAARCRSVPVSALSVIETRLTVPQGKITEAGAARSRDLNDVWLIASRIEGSDFDELAVFATDALSDPKSVLAVDQAADDATDWQLADGTNGGTEIVLGDDGTDEALECID